MHPPPRFPTQAPVRWPGPPLLRSLPLDSWALLLSLRRHGWSRSCLFIIKPVEARSFAPPPHDGLALIAALPDRRMRIRYYYDNDCK